MNLKCRLGFHIWNGCKCTVCGQTHNEGHRWNETGCLCTRCGKSNHDWERTFYEAPWVECVNTPGWQCTECYNSISRTCSGGITKPGRAEYRCKKCSAIRKESLGEQGFLIKQCFEGNPAEATESFPCRGCKYWDVINPSGENTGWCYKSDLVKDGE